MRLAALLLAAIALCLTVDGKPTAPYRTVIGDTGSMRPLWHGGEICVVSAFPFDLVAPGMIVVAEHHSMNVGHDVIAVRRAANGQKYLITKGRANARRDPWVTTAKEYIGIIVP